MKISSKLDKITLCNYYENQDELYLAVLTKGFEKLYNIYLNGYKSKNTPLERLEAMIRTYMEFGLKKVNFYNLMFTWHVPKYQDYTGTPMKKTAYHELVAAQKVLFLFIQVIKELAQPIMLLSDEEARFYIVYFWSLMHGYIAGNNNYLLNYIYEHPENLKERFLKSLFNDIHKELEEMSRGRKKKLNPNSINHNQAAQQ